MGARLNRNAETYTAPIEAMLKHTHHCGATMPHGISVCAGSMPAQTSRHTLHETYHLKKLKCQTKSVTDEKHNSMKH